MPKHTFSLDRIMTLETKKYFPIQEEYKMQIPILDTCEYDTSYTPLKLSILHPIISYFINFVQIELKYDEL